MPVGESLRIVSEPIGSPAEEPVRKLLKEEHGIFRVKFVGKTAADACKASLAISQTDEHGSDYSARFYTEDQTEVVEQFTPEDQVRLSEVVSRYSIANLMYGIDDQSSRDDVDTLRGHRGEKPPLDLDPTEWIATNPLLQELTRNHPQYGNLLRFLANERGLFLKISNYPSQRAYWNSTLNGGLPVYKKADPVHEGTFMLHDLFHFVPVDPLLGTREIGKPEITSYLAHRMMSEAVTLVLADMIAVDDAHLDAKGYEVDKRKIYPVYQSIVESAGERPAVDKLLAANVYFCFTGDAEGFRLLGASEEFIEAYKDKYESIFQDDFLWNLQNIRSLIDERDSNPLMSDYYKWVEDNTDLPTLAQYEKLSAKNGEGIDIARMLSLFRAEFTSAANYPKSIDHLARHRKASQRYYAGQRIVFARFGNRVDPSAYLKQFDQLYTECADADGQELKELTGLLDQLCNTYIDELAQRGYLLPHQAVNYKFAVPQYPVKFISYELSAQQKTASNFVDIMGQFITTNQKQLARLLEIVKS